MTEKEIIDKQISLGNNTFFLVLVGRFYHAYGGGAFALSRVMGYHVRRLQRKMGEVMVLGFPIEIFDTVRDRVREAGGEIESVDGKTWIFRGLDGTPDPSMISEPRSIAKARCQPEAQAAVAEMKLIWNPSVVESWLIQSIQKFDLSTATPIDAMLFVRNLKQRIQQQNESGACRWDGDSGFACESPSGQGSAE